MHKEAEEQQSWGEIVWSEENSHALVEKTIDLVFFPINVNIMCNITQKNNKQPLVSFILYLPCAVYLHRWRLRWRVNTKDCWPWWCKGWLTMRNWWFNNLYWCCPSLTEKQRPLTWWNRHEKCLFRETCGDLQVCNIFMLSGNWSQKDIKLVSVWERNETQIKLCRAAAFTLHV